MPDAAFAFENRMCNSKIIASDRFSHLFSLRLLDISMNRPHTAVGIRRSFHVWVFSNKERRPAPFSIIQARD